MNQPKTITAWCLFDWANSAYNLVITATIFPVYYASICRETFGNEQVIFFGYLMEASVLYSYSISFSFLIIAFLSPILSGIADYSGKKKAFMRFFTILGTLACFTLFFFTGDRVELGILASIVASIGYSGALVFYNAFLPEIATPDRYDSVSAKGFSFGYFGSVILLVINILVIKNAEFLGISASLASRWAFASVGLWWISFSQITFWYLPKERSHQSDKSVLIKGFEELTKVFKQLKTHKNIGFFLLAFFFYDAGVQTIIYVAAIFGEKEVKMPSDHLIGSILLLQLVAILGAFLAAKVSEWKGNRFSLALMLVIWTVVCFMAYFTRTENHFYGLAVAVGLVMGGSQSLSRATYSKLLPENTQDTASFFSFYDIVEKLAIVLGTFFYALIEQMTGSIRLSAVSLSVYFVLGFVFLMAVKVRKV